MIIKVLLLIGLIKLLLETNQPFVCSGIYTLCVALLTLAFGHGFVAALVVGGIVFVLSSLYFWLLDKFEGNDVVWWIIAIGGIALGFV